MPRRYPILTHASKHRTSEARRILAARAKRKQMRRHDRVRARLERKKRHFNR